MDPAARGFAIAMLLRTEGGNTYAVRAYRDGLGEAGFGEIEMEDLDAERQMTRATRIA